MTFPIIYDNKILFVSGSLATSTNCCCSGSGSGCVDTDICEEYTGNFTLTTSFTPCEDCSTACEGLPDYGTSFTLTRYQEDICAWVSGPEEPEAFCSNGIVYWSADVNLTYNYNGGDCFWQVVMICLADDEPYAYEMRFRKYGSYNPVGTYTFYAGDCAVTGSVSIA